VSGQLYTLAAPLTRTNLVGGWVYFRGGPNIAEKKKEKYLDPARNGTWIFQHIA
jgi:hypothetical protein